MRKNPVYFRNIHKDLLVYAWQIGAEIPMDSDDADEENKSDNGKTLLYIFERG
jgi:hypothetical protein